MKNMFHIKRDEDLLIIKKIWLQMRLITILLFAITFCLQANTTHSQNVKVNLNAENATLMDIFREIEKQSEYRFFYKNAVLNSQVKLNFKTENKELADVLDLLFANTDINYKLVDKYIVITTKEETEVPGLLQGPVKRQISGMVVDEQGEPVIGANIVEKGISNGVITDINGAFSLYVNEEAVIEISYIGYIRQEVRVADKTFFNIILKEDTQSLEEVVVVGYGTQKKLNLTGAVSSVKSDVLVKSPAANTINTLAGRLPGLVMKQTSGQPGFDGASINIRNFGNALVIVDGVEQSFANINPTEIESISILKDASAAIYGARAGNGVILVTTKRGAMGKPVISINSSITGQSYTNFPEPVNAGQYATLYREVQINSGIPEEQLLYTKEDIAKYFAGNDPQYPNTDWMDVIMRKWSPQHQHNVSVAGGGDKFKYYTFLGYLDQAGMFEGGNTGYNRYNVRSNIDIDITSQFSVSLDLSVIKEYTQQSSRPATDVWFWMDFYDSKPTAHSSFPDKSKVPHIGPGPYNAIINTHANLGGYDKRYKNTLNGAITLNYKVKQVEGLSAKVRVNYYQSMQERKVWRKQSEVWDYDYESDTYTLFGKSEPTQLTQSYLNNQNITGQFSVHYDRTFNNTHAINGLLLFEVIDYADNNFSAFRQHYITSAIDQLFAGGASDQLADGSAYKSGRISYVARLNYGYKGKYLAEGTLRYDGSPNFPKSKRWGAFPSISLGWRLSEESFIKDNLLWLNNLKLRGGISQTGFDAVSAYQYLTGFKFSGYYVVNGKEESALVSTGLANKNITWETLTLSNIGLDFSVYNNKFYGEFDVFRRLRDDMLGKRNASLPNTFGASLPDENINSQVTKGFEALLGYRGRAGDFKYDISGNISYSRSKWKHFDEVEYTDPDEIRIHKRTGRWTDISFGYKTDGLFTSQSEIDNLPYDMDGQKNSTLSPGDIKILDINNDGVVDWRDTEVINNGGTPHWMYGINIAMDYKRFDLSMLLQGAANYTLQLQPGNINIDSERTPYKVIWEERWTPENNDKNAIIPRQKFGQLTNNWNSDYWNRDASYLRLKNITLGYSFAPALLSKAKIEQLRVYLTGTNLFTISKLQKYGLDPESPDATRGWTYPIQKTVTLGLNINF